MTVRAAAGQDQLVEASAVQSSTAPDDVSFRGLFDAHYVFVWRSLVHLGVPTAAADDAAQEVFLVVHRRIGSYDHTQPLRAWLWGIARNVASNQRRTDARDARRRSALEAERSSVPAVDAAHELAFVREIVLAMEPGMRDVLVLSDIEGLTAVEIASALEANVNTIYSRLRIARKRFADEANRRGHRVGESHGR